MSVVKKHILVCAKKKPEGIPSCQAAGGLELFDQFRSVVYKAGLEKEVAVTTTGCIGLCKRGPNVIVYPEGKWYTAVAQSEAEAIMRSHLEKSAAVDRPDPSEEAIRAELDWFHDKSREILREKGLL